MSGRIKGFLFNIIVSLCFIGYLPKGGGSAASLVGLLYYLVFYKNISLYLWTLFSIMVSGLILGNYSERYFKTKDPSKFVIDDFAGMLVAFSFVPPKPFFIITGFLLYRFFDIVKIYPIGRLEDLKGGWGIMLDDIAAGLYVNLLIQVFLRKFA